MDILKIDNKIKKALKDEGIKELREVQKLAIPTLLDGKDLIGSAPTGSGKTFAFLIPTLEKINIKQGSIQALVLVPTRELAMQIHKEVVKLNKYSGFKILLTYGGQDINYQLKDSKGAQILISTPGRLLDILKRKALSLKEIKNLIIDEADQMLYMGFKNEIEEILKYTNKKKQVICFSATMGSDVKKIAYRYTKDPVVIDVHKKEKKNIVEYLVDTTDRWKVDALCEILNETNPYMGIVFCRTKARVDRLTKRLDERGYSCQKIHSDIPQAKREKIMKAFRDGDIQYLIATDVAARGLHIEGLSHIYNYDIPEELESYTHRVGRTGRSADEGETYLFVTPKGYDKLDEIRRLDFVELIEKKVKGEKNVVSTNPRYSKKYNKKIKVK